MTIGKAAVAFVVSVVSAVFAAVRLLVYLLPFIAVALVISIMAVYVLPEQSTTIAAIELGMREIAYQYREIVRPLLIVLSEALNTIICWYNTFVYLANYYLRSILRELFTACNGISLLPPAAQLIRVVVADIAIAQALNPLYFFSYPINTTAIVQPMKDLGTATEAVLCCGCQDLCFMAQWLLSPLQDDNLYCVIQSAFDIFFWMIRPALDYAFNLVYTLPVTRPRFIYLSRAICRLADCAANLIGNFLQYLVDNIVGIGNVNFANILCPVTWVVCAASQVVATVVEAGFNADRIINFPADDYLITQVRDGLRVILNMIDLPTEVVHVETYFPVYASDVIGSPPAYDYSTRLLASQLPYGTSLRTCLCTAVNAVTLNISSTIDVCAIFGLLRPIVDLGFFVFDFGVNIFRFRTWAPRIDFAWVDSLFLPDGALAIIPAIIDTFNTDIGIIAQVLIGMAGELVRWVFEIIRLPLVGKDVFGFFLPPSLGPPVSIRCSRFPVSIVPAAASSCTWFEAATIFFPGLLKKLAIQICTVETGIANDFLAGAEVQFFCGIATDLVQLTVTIWTLIINVLYAIIFSDPEGYFGDFANELLQQQVEILAVYIVKLPSNVCTVVKVLFSFFNLPSTADPCANTTVAIQQAVSKGARMAISILVNFGREWSISSPYFVPGQQQHPTINRALLSGYDALGRESQTGPRGDVEQVVEAFVSVLFAPFSIAELIPFFEGVVITWQTWAAGIGSAVARLPFTLVLAIFQGDSDYFLDFTTSVARDTYWRKTSRFVSLFAYAADLFQAPIIWGQPDVAPDLKNIDTVTPDEYPTELGGGVGNFVSPDIFAPEYDDGFSTPQGGVIPTLGQCWRLTTVLFFGNVIGPKLICPAQRIFRALISLTILGVEVVARLMATLVNIGGIKAYFIDWMFGCVVPGNARQYGFMSILRNPPPGSAFTISNVAATCADFDGVLVSAVQVFRCPCDWLKNIRYGPLKCLCGPDSLAAIGNGSMGAGIISSAVELYAEVARVFLVIFRNGLAFNGSFSISGQVISPIMISVTRAIYASTCILTSLFADTCTEIFWWAVVKTGVQIVFSVPYFAGGIIDRTMQQAIGVSKKSYKGGMTGKEPTGYNAYKFNNNDQNQCDPNVNPRGCGGRDPEAIRPTKADPGEEGYFTLVAQLIFPATQFGIDLLGFVNCCISKSLDKIAKGSGSFVNATLGGLIDILKVVQSVFFSLLHFVWQMLELLFFFLTRKIKNFTDLVKAAKIGFRAFKTIIRALVGHPADSHAYFGTGDKNIEDAVEDCQSDPIYATFEAALPPMATPAQQAAAIAARDAWFIACLSDTLDVAVPPEVLNYISPSINAGNRRGDTKDHAIQNDEELRASMADAILDKLPKQSSGARRGDSTFNKAVWVQWGKLYAASKKQIYSADPLDAMGAMASTYHQNLCRHDNIAACICPWEPEIAAGTDLCAPGRVMTEADEQELLQRSFVFSFTGTTKCDGIVGNMAQKGRWLDASYMERAALAECLNFRAISVHAAKEFCANLEPGDICMWPRNLWYQPDRTAAFIAAGNAHDTWLRLRPAFALKPGQKLPPTREQVMHHRRERLERLINDTDLPEEVRTAWAEDQEARKNDRQTRKRTYARRRKAPQEMTAHQKRIQRQEEAVRFHKEGDPVFLEAVQTNLTAGLYDQETTEWLRGRTNMPLDILLRPHGPTLWTQVVTQGSPCLFSDPRAHWDSPKWRRGEFDGDHTIAEKLIRGSKEEMDAHIFGNYSSQTLDGFRYLDGAHRRPMLYFIKGWEDYSGHHHHRRAPTFRRRSPEENLATFEDRRDARLRRVAHLARKTGMVGPVSRTVHRIPPDVQQATLDAMKTLDYLFYGVASGAFMDAINTLDEAPPEALEEEDTASYWSKISGAYSRASYNWNSINNMLANHGGHPPDTLPALVWNGTVATIKTAAAYYDGTTGDSGGGADRSGRSGRSAEEEEEDDLFADGDEEEDPVTYKDDETLTGVLTAHWNPSLNATVMPSWLVEWWNRPVETADSKESASVRTRSDPIYQSAPSIFTVHPIPNANPKHSRETFAFRSTFLAAQAGLYTSNTQVMLSDLDVRYSSALVPSPAKQNRQSRQGDQHSPRFIFGPTCRVVDFAVTEFLRVLRHCPAYSPPPILPPSSVRNTHRDDGKVVVYHPIAPGQRPSRYEPHHLQEDRAAPGSSQLYGEGFSELERLAKLIDYLASKIPFVGKVSLADRLRSLLTSSSTFWTNTNMDEDAGPVGARYWVKVVLQCRYPQSVDCMHGVGLLQAVQDVVPRALIVYVAVGIFLPYNVGVPVMFLLMPATGLVIGVHAWRYSPMCWTHFMIPMCLINDLDQLFLHFLRTCNENWFPVAWSQDGIVCPARGVPINVLDCRPLGINSGFAVLAGSMRAISELACSRFAGILETFVIFGPHGVAPQATRFVRATCEKFSTASPELAKQQNVCIVWNIWLLLPIIVTLMIVGVIVFFGYLLFKAAFIFAAIALPALASLVRFQRPEYIPGTGTIAEPLQAGDEYGGPR